MKTARVAAVAVWARRDGRIDVYIDWPGRRAVRRLCVGSCVTTGGAGLWVEEGLEGREVFSSPTQTSRRAGWPGPGSGPNQMCGASAV